MTTIEVRYMGGIEVPTGRGYRWVNGYSVVVDGKVTYPWTPKKQAEAEAKKLRKELAKT